jgi:hypothetical protein
MFLFHASDISVICQWAIPPIFVGVEMVLKTGRRGTNVPLELTLMMLEYDGGG